MKTEHQEIVEKHIQNLGFEDIYAFALEQLIRTELEDLQKNNLAIENFEQKYQRNFEDFDKNFHEIEGDHFEKEDDSMEWEVRLSMRSLQEKSLEKLQSLKEEQNDTA